MLRDQGLIISGLSLLMCLSPRYRRRSLLIIRRRQRAERQIRQRARRHNDQPFAAELRSHRAEQHLAERPGLSDELRVWRSPGSRARGEQFVNPASGGFEFGARRKLVAIDGSLRNEPKVTALFAERVFEQQCIFIERLLLNFRRPKWLRLG